MYLACYLSTLLRNYHKFWVWCHLVIFTLFIPSIVFDWVNHATLWRHDFFFFFSFWQINKENMQHNYLVFSHRTDKWSADDILKRLLWCKQSKSMLEYSLTLEYCLLELPAFRIFFFSFFFFFCYYYWNAEFWIFT